MPQVSASEAYLLQQLVESAKAADDADPTLRWALEMHMLVRRGVLDDLVSWLVRHVAFERAKESDWVPYSFNATCSRRNYHGLQLWAYENGEWWIPGILDKHQQAAQRVGSTLFEEAKIAAERCADYALDPNRPANRAVAPPVSAPKRRKRADDTDPCPECGQEPDQLHKLECSHREKWTGG